MLKRCELRSVCVPEARRLRREGAQPGDTGLGLTSLGIQKPRGGESRHQRSSTRESRRRLTASHNLPRTTATATTALMTPSSVFNTQPEVSDLPLAMRQILLRAAVLLMSWAIGLLIAAWIVPGVSLSVPGFIVAVVVFSVAQAILSLPMLKLPRQYASLLLGGTGLALTIVALILASVLTHGITIDGMAPWVATTVVVWLVTTIGAITLPELLIRDESGST